jgi:LmbE family N-acetylglucosaminyl deacetylase
MVKPMIVDSPIACTVGDRMRESLRFPPLARTLAVVAPHPDDETLAAGGLMFDLVRAGWEVSIVVVSDGAASHPEVHDLRDVRADECRKASSALGVGLPPTFLGFPDGQVGTNLSKVARALQHALSNVEVVVAPRADDGHRDHDATATALDMAFDRSGPARLHYAIWGWEGLSAAELDLGRGTNFYPSAAALDAKRIALQHYQSQITELYGHIIVGPTLIARHTSDTEVFWW